MTHNADAASVDASSYAAYKLTSPQLTIALLKAGANPRVNDYDGNTALHLNAITNPFRTDLAKILLENGSHIDAINKKSEKFEDILNNKERFDSLNPLKYTSLMCLAARAIVKSKININRVPQHLRDFVLQH